jgi:hypothetical protein
MEESALSVKGPVSVQHAGRAARAVQRRATAFVATFSTLFTQRPYTGTPRAQQV